MKNAILIINLFCSSLLFAQTTEHNFIIEGMSCQACANTATNAIKTLKGVDSVWVDIDTKKTIVIGKVSQQELREIIDTETNFETLFEGEQLQKPLSKEALNKLDYKEINGGEKLKFKENLAANKITIFEFHATWCVPCKVYGPKVEHLVNDNAEKLALRKVDVVNWKSALAKQLTKDYELPGLPFTIVMDDKGNFLGKVKGNDIETLKKIIGK